MAKILRVGKCKKKKRKEKKMMRLKIIIFPMIVQAVYKTTVLTFN